MKSLRLRLILLATVATLMLLAIAGIVFFVLFQRQLETFTRDELNLHFEQIIAGLEFDEDGSLLLEGNISDPRFEQPFGGLYWQASAKDAKPLRSRSLWDEGLPDLPDGQSTLVPLQGPQGVELMALSRVIALPLPNGGEKQANIIVASDASKLNSAITDFGRRIAFGLASVGLALLAAMFTIILLGLRPLATLKHDVEKLRKGQSQRIDGNHLQEVAPLVDELNALMDSREKQLERARQRAGNLAHGLKTPITVIGTLANDAEARGEDNLAQALRENAGQMRDLIDRELARSRMSTTNTGHRTPLLKEVERVVETMKRAPGNDRIQWRVSVPEKTVVSMDRIDLLELLGNVLDNARKHAHGRVEVAHANDTLTIADDGPGVSPEKRNRIMRRGVKLDALAAGSGLGLAIVGDLAEVYDFSVAFKESEWGGLKVEIGLVDVG